MRGPALDRITHRHGAIGAPAHRQPIKCGLSGIGNVREDGMLKIISILAIT